jgi:hypothetical protein
MLYNYMLQFYRDAIWDAKNTWMVVGNFQKVTGKEKEKKKENER